MKSSLSCTESWRRQVAAYHDGAGSEQQRHIVAAHLRTCESCRNLMASYDHVYRKVRALPGFEGMLTIDRPTSRRSAKPVITWNRRALPTGHPEHHTGWNGGIAAFLLFVIITIAIITSKGATVTGPLSAPTFTTSAASTFAPTFGPQTTNGLACANAGNNIAQPYAYIDANNVIWKVVGCNQPIKVATLHIGNARLGSWSPDGQWLTIFVQSPQAGETTTLYVVNATTGVLEPLHSAGSGGGTSTNADQALWLDSNTLIVRAQTTLSKITVTTNTSTAIDITDATRIALFNSMLFYSTTTAQLWWRDLATNTTVNVLTLAKADAAWDVSADGNYVAFTQGSGAMATVAYWTVQSKVITTLFTVPATMTVQALQFSPNGYHIAALLASVEQRAFQIAVSAFTNNVPARYPTQGTFVWRADGLAIVAEPSTATGQPKLIDITTGAQTTLPPKTTDYVWQAAV